MTVRLRSPSGSTGPAGWTPLRAGRDADAEEFIALIGACWSEYPGCVLDIDGEVPELRRLASYYAELGGALWVADAAAGIEGMAATRPLDAQTWELCKMYVGRSARGTGLAHALASAVEAHALSRGAACIKLWTDTRFDRAHRFYEKRGYVRSGPVRDIGDKSNSLEFAYAKSLGRESA